MSRGDPGCHSSGSAPTRIRHRTGSRRARPSRREHEPSAPAGAANRRSSRRRRWRRRNAPTSPRGLRMDRALGRARSIERSRATADRRRGAEVAADEQVGAALARCQRGSMRDRFRTRHSLPSLVTAPLRARSEVVDGPTAHQQLGAVAAEHRHPFIPQAQSTQGGSVPACEPDPSSPGRWKRAARIQLADSSGRRGLARHSRSDGVPRPIPTRTFRRHDVPRAFERPTDIEETLVDFERVDARC